jgi:hypothetical protein
MHRIVRTLLLGLMAGSAIAQDWGSVATISTTMGVSGSRLCLGEGPRGDIGCPAYAPSVTTAGDVSVSGNLSANKFIGNGSGLTGVTAASADRITSGNAVSTQDRTINPDLERFMAKRMGSKTIEIEASHLALISHPDPITNLILEALAV